MPINRIDHRFLPLFLAVPWLGGCADSPPAAPPASAAPPVVTTPAAEDGLRIVPRKDWGEVARLADYRAEGVERPQSIDAMEITGTGASIVHLMLYQDSTRRKSDTDPWIKEREISAYVVIPFSPSSSKPSIGDPPGGQADSPEPYRLTTRRICVIDVRSQAVTISTSQTTDFLRGDKWTAADKSVDQLRIPRAAPDKAHEQTATIVPAEAATLGHQPKVSWYHSTTVGDGASVRQLPATPAPGTFENLATYESIAGQVAVSIEHLPFSNSLSDDALHKLADEYQARAETNPQDTAARYYFAWATIFAPRSEAVTKAIALLDEARAQEPLNRLLPAVRGWLCLQVIQSNTFDDEAIALRYADELLQHDPTADACDRSAYQLARISGSGHSPERTAMIARLLREALTLDSPIPDLMQIRLRRWQKYLTKDFSFSNTPVNQVLEEFAKLLPAQ